MSLLQDKLAILDKIAAFATSIKTWKQLFIKLLLILTFFVMAVIWYKWDDVFSAWKHVPTTVIDLQALEADKAKKFNAAADEQLSIVHSITGADFSAVFSFRPKNQNYFVDVVAWKGKLPSVLDPSNLGGFPIDKSSEEYNIQINGLYYISSTASAFLPTKEVIPVAYTFSCPYFNLENYYSGSVLMEWYKSKPNLTDTRLTIVCSQAARTLGRIR
ncbi:holin [Pantoea phage Phynn]|nr:holin [Pantoea phage Phynn]